MKAKLLSDLIDWGLANGAVLPDGVKFEFADPKGISCICELELEKPLLSIPKDLIISSKLVPLEFPNVAVTDSGSTGLKFLLSKLKFNANSCTSDLSQKFKPYLDCLPTLVDSPLTWNPLEMELLHGTNLGNSIPNKLRVVLKEWYEFLDRNNLFEKSILDDREKYRSISELSIESIFEWLIQPLANESHLNWLSPSAFLWSHLMLISRAFPEYIVDQSVDPSSVMLLPVLDLLNHDYYSKVEWSFTGDKFIYKQLELISSGKELCNNYGAKGNEELLFGYGFVLEDNPFDFVALRIKLPQETLSKILLEESDLKLPTIDDYTSFAFDYKPSGMEKVQDAASLEDGIVYFINKLNPACLEPLLNIFSYLCHDCDVFKWHDLISRFKGVQNLRIALESKLEATIKHTSLNDSKDCKTIFEVRPYIKHCAKVYRSGQVSVLKHSLGKLKAIEKELLTDNKNRLLTVTKILKYDIQFTEEELPAFFSKDGPEYDEIELERFELLVVWILIKLKNDSFIKKHSWIYDQYKTFNENKVNDYPLSSEGFDLNVLSFYKRLTKSATNGGEFSLSDVQKAFNFLDSNSFTRIASSNPETIVVKS